MRVLLLNPAIRAEQFGRFASLLEPMPCIGVAYVATFLARAGHEVRVYDDFALRGGEEAVLALLRDFRPQALGVSVLTPVANAMKALMQRARTSLPQLRIFAGNLHADLFPEEFAGLCEAIVHGEGEQASVDLLAAWESGESGQGIAGVTVYAEDGSPVRGPDRPAERDLDSYPFPDWSLLPYSRYSLLPLGTIARPIVAIAASRGCPYSCSYCSLTNQGGIYRQRSVANVVDEIEHDVLRYGVKQLGFMDPIFPINDRHAVRFADEMERRGLNERVVWLSELRTDSVTRAGLQAMKRSGARRLVFGIETGDDVLLEGVSKRNTGDRSRQTIAHCRELGITTVGLFMIGLPGETPEQTRATVDYACSLQLDFAKFAITVPFPGSPLFDQMRAEGLDRRDWENYTTFNPDAGRIVVASKVQSPEQLLRALRLATFRFYMRPRMIARQLFKVRTIDARQMAAGLWSLVPDLPKLRA